MEMVTREEGGAGMPEKGDAVLLQIVSFWLSEEEYGVDILQVQEIIRVPPITKVPQAPPSVAGVINLRGKVLPVMSLRLKLGLAEKPYDDDTRIIVVNVGDLTIGIVVDSVSEVLRLSSDTIEPPPPIVSAVSAECLKGVGKIGDRLLMLVDLPRLVRM